MVLPAGAREDDDLAGPGRAVGADGELALSAIDERLPWLSSDDDEHDRGVDTGRVVAFASVGLLALILLVGAIWWFSREPGQQDQLAEGSIIEAPEAPYKTRPEDPGGREVEGTGDTSFEVAEGRRVEGRVRASAAPAPSIDREQRAAQSSGQSSGQSSAQPQPAVVPSGIGVQVGAYTSKPTAEAGWSELVRRYEVLQGVSHRVVEGRADSGTVYRLQAVAGDVAAAEGLCRSIKAAGGDCQVKR